MIVALLAFAAAHNLRILMLGNSHTANNDVGGMLQSMLNSDGSSDRASVTVRIGAMLEDLARDETVRQMVSQRGWDFVVLQGAGLSSSHKYRYSQEGAIALAKSAKAGGARALLFAEWPRQGWDETGYILGIYGEIASASGAEVVPICQAWDLLLARSPKEPLWMADGNHASLEGSTLAAYTLYFWIRGPSAAGPTYRPAGVSAGLASELIGIARKVRL